MSRVSSSYELLRGLGTLRQATQLLGGAIPTSLFPGPSFDQQFASDVSLIDSGRSVSALLSGHASVDDSTRLSNTLSTANDAIGVIGGLLGNIQHVLTAASDPVDPLSQDTATEQSRIDAAVSTIDTIASSTHFGGQNLLDGSFTLTGSGSDLSLPSFRSTSLGASADAGASPPLDSLITGAAKSLTSGNLHAASQVVAAALSQVSSSQQSISAYRLTALPPDLAARQFALSGIGVSVADELFVTAAQMLLAPAGATAATANSQPQNVFGLIRFT
jgi:hypothetical protein